MASFAMTSGPPEAKDKIDDRVLKCLSTFARATVIIPFRQVTTWPSANLATNNEISQLNRTVICGLRFKRNLATEAGGQPVCHNTYAERGSVP